MSLDNDDGQNRIRTYDGNLSGIAKNCSYDINMIYSSLQASKIWAVRGHKDFVYIFSRQDTQGVVSTIQLSPKNSSTRKSPTLMSNETFSSEEKMKSTLNLNAMSEEEKTSLMVQKHIFVFSFGAIVVWGGNKGTRRTLEQMLRPFESDAIDLSSEEDRNSKKS